MNVPQPWPLSFERWGSELFAQLLEMGTFTSQPESEDAWRWWTERLNEVGELEVPYHREFTNWQEWAERFLQVNEDVVI